MRYRLFPILFLVPLDAYAYIDPGMGILMWQGFLAVLGGILFVVRSPKEALKKIIKKFRDRSDAKRRALRGRQ
jgi:hypothetical protein